MLVNLNKKKIHCLMPKTGSGTAWDSTFNTGFEKYPMHSGIKQLRQLNSKLADEIKKEQNEWTISCVIRNPWDHAVSYYYHTIDSDRFFSHNFYTYTTPGFAQMSDAEKIKNANTDFNDYVEKIYLKTLSQSHVLDSDMDPERNFINMFLNYNSKEHKSFIKDNFNIDSSTKRVHDRRNIKNVLNLPPIDDYRKFYDATSYELILNNCKEEIGIFNYEF